MKVFIINFLTVRGSIEVNTQPNIVVVFTDEQFLQRKNFIVEENEKMVCFHQRRTLEASLSSLQGPGHLEIHLPFPASPTKKYTQDLISSRFQNMKSFLRSAPLSSGVGWEVKHLFSLFIRLKRETSFDHKIEVQQHQRCMFCIVGETLKGRQCIASHCNGD